MEITASGLLIIGLIVISAYFLGRSQGFSAGKREGSRKGYGVGQQKGYRKGKQVGSRKGYNAGRRSRR